MKIEFTKLIRKVKEGENYKPSLIAYAKEPWMRVQTKTISPPKVVQWRYFLYINLWLIEVTFRWESKV